MGFYRGPNIVTNGLVLSLDAANPKSYVSGSSIVRDVSGTAVTGSLINSPLFSTTNNGIINFDGIDDYVTIPHSTTYKELPITFECCVKLISDDAVNSVFRCDESLSRHSGYTVSIGTSGISLTLGNNTVNDIPGRRTYTSPSTTLLNTWYNISWVIQDLYTVKLYVNGIETSFPYINGTAVSYVYDTTYSTFGRRTNAGGGIAIYYTDMVLSNVRIYNRVLSSQEIEQNYDALKGRFGID